MYAYSLFYRAYLKNHIFCHLSRAFNSTPSSPIHTNSIILIDRLGPLLGHNKRHEVLGAACAKALKDSFPQSHVAAVVAYMACANFVEVEELAGKVVGLVAGTVKRCRFVSSGIVLRV